MNEVIMDDYLDGPGDEYPLLALMDDRAKAVGSVDMKWEQLLEYHDICIESLKQDRLPIPLRPKFVPVDIEVAKSAIHHSNSNEQNPGRLVRVAQRIGDALQRKSQPYRIPRDGTTYYKPYILAAAHIYTRDTTRTTYWSRYS